MTKNTNEPARGAQAAKTFRIVMSERCFRFKPDALFNHAPPLPGIYEFITFDENKQGKTLYVGLALDKSVQDALAEHLSDDRAPGAPDLFGKYPNAVYFDYVVHSDAETPEDLKDIAGELIRKNRPEFNDLQNIPASGRYRQVEIKEVEIL
ncbi:MAG: hypothetical protein A3G41_00810 [Elusimicrobia bacterium RIFCSPLOWO2_12_FULL_59_9]|nr:MAG: hypothetical protein A3G41_00810 [Elusimicrobia bacterium RIFCSPLOWO2_12_FULL_59_9]